MKKLFSLIFFLLGIVGIVAAQTGSIRGSIKTSDGKPAEFVNVSLKGSAKGTIADKNGIYLLKNVPAGAYTIVATYIGLETKEAKVNVKSGEVVVLDFTLAESSLELQEMVIFGKANKYKDNTPSPSLRINTPIIEAPQNIQIITKGVLLDQQVFDMLEGVQRNISGAQKVEHWDNYARINMRGSQLTSFRNGINMQLSPWSPLPEDMSIVEKIEFVKGPAGFMLANGEPSGFYNIVTKKPTGREKGEVAFTLGSYDTYRVSSDLDGKLSKSGRLLYRINLMGQLKGSHRDYEFNNRYTVAPVLKYLIDENTTFTLEYTEQSSQVNVIGSNYAFSKRKYADLPVNFTTSEPNLDPSNMRDRSVLALFEHNLNDRWKLTAQASYLYYNQVGQSIWPKGFSTKNDSLMQRGISIWDALGYSKGGQIFINGSIKTGKVVHNIFGGLDMNYKDYYADWNQSTLLGDDSFNIYKPIYGSIAATSVPQWDRSKDIRERGVRYSSGYSGLYLQDEIALFDNKLRVTLAGRYTTNKDINPYGGTAKDSKFTPRFGLSWSVDRSLSAYFVYDQVFKGNFGSDWQGNTFNPITGTNLEVGVKKDWFKGRWNTTIAAYQIVKNNILTADLEHPDPKSGQFVYSRQTGQQKVKGVEFDLRGELVEGLEVVMNYAYTDAKVTKDSDPKIVGSKVAGASKSIQNTWMTYRIGGGVLNGVRFSMGYQFQAGRSSWFVFDGSESSLPDYFRLDGGVSYDIRNMSINLLVNNVLDKYLYSGAPSGNMYYWQAEPPRNYRITVTYRF